MTTDLEWPDPTDEQIDQVTEILDAHFYELSKRFYGTETAPLPYDGIRGHLPDWMPKWAHHRYFRVQQYLVDQCGYTPDRVLQHISAYGQDQVAAMRNHPNGDPIDYAFGWHESVGFLAHLRWCVSASDPQDGLRRLNDTWAAKGLGLQKASQKGGQATAAKSDVRKEMAQHLIDELSATGHYKKHGGLTRMRAKVANELKISVDAVTKWGLRPGNK